MGVQSYFPRFILPGAKVSEQALNLAGFVLPANTKVLIGEPESAPLAVVKASPELKKAVPDTLKNALAASSATAATELGITEKPAVAPDTSAVNEARFQFAFIRVSDKLCILNQIPYVGIKQQLSMGHKALLLNILKALQLSTAAVNFDAMTFRWPLVEGEHVDKSAEAARAALSAYLEQQMSEKNSQVLLAMGTMAASYSLPKNKQGELENNAFSSVDGQNWQIAKIRSLDEILSMPQVKRDVWRQLRSLHLHALS